MGPWYNFLRLLRQLCPRNFPAKILEIVRLRLWLGHFKAILAARYLLPRILLQFSTRNERNIIEIIRPLEFLLIFHYVPKNIQRG